ncbi:MAG: ABC transporter ATP-binding protein [Rhodospirillales bacterium]|jgi:iron(III) transport system ATP-binding protein|nr:Fe3+/spermidine/putrescine ABC transporter ATP-binding protein [Rhodospirillaceae bacterium]MDP6429068.1 ABC transporter ATP-binding protein [Rhodospirillales bacterium]MDP6644270.1 ABC transporter ATP-binding protein [Rhodospirillales bacterium]|tara:strand:+ start:2658 stop:3785 length:1128 start_codon:yes stop_codon:yes gene_type:complete
MLRVKNLSKTYETPEGPARAVKGIDFEVGEGEFYTLLGPSGCGKTTTLRCIAGLEKPDGGEIFIDGDNVANPAEEHFAPTHHRNIGMVFQSYAIWPHFDVFNNVAYPLQVKKPRPPKAEINDLVMDALTQVGMEDFAKRPATKISGGQQQRVALARALVRRPKLLLLDEPLSNLDAKLREQMRIELEEMVARIAITTLYVTHDQSEALSMSDRVAVMSDGLIIQEDEPRIIYGQPANEFVASFLGTANFINGVIAKRINDDTGIVDINDGNGKLEVALSSGQESGDVLQIVVRPEDIHATSVPPEDLSNVLEGVVDLLNFQGGYTECFVHVGALRLRSIVHQSLRANPGDKIWLSVDPRHCVIFSGKNKSGAEPA